jgi:hypothetical protein
MDKNHHFATKMLRYHGFITRSDVTSQFVGWDAKKDIGRSDIFAARNWMPINVEVKQGVTGFLMPDWTDKQRNWGLVTSEYPFCIPYYVFLTLGNQPVDLTEGENIFPRRSWLIPLEKFLSVDQIVNQYQKTLVYRVGKRSKVKMREANVDAVTMLKDYELSWAKSNTLPVPFWMLYKLDISDLEDDLIIEKLKHKRTGGFWIIPESHEVYKKFGLQPIVPADADLDKVKAILKRSAVKDKPAKRDTMKTSNSSKYKKRSKKYGYNNNRTSH